jgi:hypothetical protein
MNIEILNQFSHVGLPTCNIIRNNYNQEQLKNTEDLDFWETLP